MGTEIYGEEYARRYVESTLSSPYTVYKNERIAQVAYQLGKNSIVDLGCNINGLVRSYNSLRYQAESFGIGYVGLDLSPHYFDKNTANNLDIPTFDIVNGIVGDITALPFGQNTIELAVSADVIEHISSPETALAEVHRILNPNGSFILVIPSMYKLDGMKIPSISSERASTHENKFDVAEWKGLCETAGFTIDNRYSHPIGIASGLTYLSWMDEKYVPRRPNLYSRETYSPEAHLHKKTKQIISKIDPIYDLDAQKETKKLVEVIEKIERGKINEVLANLCQELLSNDKYYFPTEERITIEAFSDSIQNIQVDDEKRELLSNAITFESEMFLGNSALLVLHK